ncbi:Tetraspanin-11 [Trichoplax sp. H2]|nr:Tetraspanin-11 [Trichoplax sp. H2]|eukprot:RDD46652.1 Tetraspanin-11 [Trichoplax sp. H2]
MAIKGEVKAKGKMKYARWSLFAFNIVFWIMGITTVGVGVWILISNANTSVLTNNLFRTGTILVIVSGCFIGLIGFLGWFGAYQEHACLIGMFTSGLIIVCLLEIAAGVWAGVNQGQEIQKLTTSLITDVIEKYGKPSNAPLSKALDAIQHRYFCCGANNYTDWSQSLWNTNKDFKPYAVPSSCCRPAYYVDGCGEDSRVRNVTNPAGGIYTRGCQFAIRQHISEHSGAILGIGISVAIVQVFGIFCSVLLLDYYRHYEDEPSDVDEETSLKGSEPKENLVLNEKTPIPSEDSNKVIDESTAPVPPSNGSGPLSGEDDHSKSPISSDVESENIQKVPAPEEPHSPKGVQPTAEPSPITDNIDSAPSQDAHHVDTSVKEVDVSSESAQKPATLPTDSDDHHQLTGSEIHHEEHEPSSSTIHVEVNVPAESNHADPVDTATTVHHQEENEDLEYENAAF